ncbi:hypothetical protein HY949_03750 [Candidatus Gottesmanbacteria bacterium]|nr:hypothetical protein [Candidatus Gottesmanbacteria bacterium]
MNDQTPEEPTVDPTKSLPVIGGAFLVLVSVVFLAYQYSKPRNGTVVLPGGITYLGPSPTVQIADGKEQITNNKQQTTDNRNKTQSGDLTNTDPARFTATASVPWTTVKSRKYGYTFSIPETLTLEPFLTDEFDAYAITWNNVAKEANVLIGVEDLSKDEKRAPYVKKTKKEYIESFWSKQYNLTGVKTLVPFTNGKGLKGYKVKFKTKDGVSPYDDVFLEVLGRPNLVIHLSNAILDPLVFEKIVESVGWYNPTNPDQSDQ